MNTVKYKEKARNLPVQWREQSWAPEVGVAPGRWPAGLRPRAGRLDAIWLEWRGRRCRRRGGFTILEMLIVVTIIGFLAAMAMPHLSGMSKANSMTAAAQQMTGAVNLARRMAVSHRSTVFLAFVSPQAFTGPLPPNNLTTYSNLMLAQYTAYALVSPRSVGDQPGRPNPQYLTEWKALPAGVFIPPYMFNPGLAQFTVFSTNTLSNQRNAFTVEPFGVAPIPFPAANSPTVGMACIAFGANGQLAGNSDAFIPLARGAVQYLPGNTVNAVESPSGNSTNDCNLIHIDFLTARAKLERNQF